MNTSRCRIWTLSAALLGLLLTAQAAWYWPFDFDPDSTNKPPRLHRLLEKANEYIELAEDEALEGNGDKAIENYRLALRELDRVEEEHPDRAESPEFAPLRSKRATCSAAIDSIRFAQVNENERAVSVTNTRELERKWRKKHNKMTPEDIAAEKKEAEEKKAAAEKKEAVDEKNAPEEGLRRLKADIAAKSPPTTSGNDAAFQARLREAYEHMQKGRFAAADNLLEDLEKERGTDLNVLLLRAASQSGVGSNNAARRTLERAMRAHPKSYKPYYNLAWIVLKLGEDVTVAREYYDLGRAVGGPTDAALERKLK